MRKEKREETKTDEPKSKQEIPFERSNKKPQFGVGRPYFGSLLSFTPADYF